MNEKIKGNAVLWGVIGLLLVVIVVMAILLYPGGTDNENQPVYTDGSSTGETMITEDPGITVENPYMTYHYSSDLANVVAVRQTAGENRHEDTFVTDIFGEELVLFSVVLGKEAEKDGFELGILEDETLGKVHVVLMMNEQQAEDWSEENFTRINALQERINDIIVQFNADPRFTANQ